MPNIQNFTTEELLDAMDQFVAPAGQAYLDELRAREIKQDDEDDTEQHRGGIRPNHQPLV